MTILLVIEAALGEQMLETQALTLQSVGTLCTVFLHFLKEPAIALSQSPCCRSTFLNCKWELLYVAEQWQFLVPEGDPAIPPGKTPKRENLPLSHYCQSLHEWYADRSTVLLKYWLNDCECFTIGLLNDELIQHIQNINRGYRRGIVVGSATSRKILSLSENEGLRVIKAARREDKLPSLLSSP